MHLVFSLFVTSSNERGMWSVLSTHSFHLVCMKINQESCFNKTWYFAWGTPNTKSKDHRLWSIFNTTSPLSATLSRNFCNLLRSMRLFNFWYNDVIKTTMTFRPFLWFAIYWQPSQNSGFTYFELRPWRAGQWLIVSLCASYIYYAFLLQKR